MSENASKGRFLKPDELQNDGNERKIKENLKERARRRKEREGKKEKVALLVFIIATLEIVFGGEN